MGPSYSKTENMASQYLDAVTSVMTDILNNQTVTTLQNQGIKVENAQGDVIISGNTFDQSIKVDSKSVLNAFVQTKVQQDLFQKLSQLADSENKALSFLQFTSAYNDYSSTLNAMINISTTIKQTCNSAFSQSQTIDLNYVGGVTKITDNTFKQTQDIVTKCLMDTTVKNEVFQRVDQTAEQDAKAKNSGIDWKGILYVCIVVLFILIALLFLPNAFEKLSKDVHSQKKQSTPPPPPPKKKTTTPSSPSKKKKPKSPKKNKTTPKKKKTSSK